MVIHIFLGVVIAKAYLTHKRLKKVITCSLQPATDGREWHLFTIYSANTNTFIGNRI